MGKIIHAFLSGEQLELRSGGINGHGLKVVTMATANQTSIVRHHLPPVANQKRVWSAACLS